MTFVICWLPSLVAAILIEQDVGMNSIGGKLFFAFEVMMACSQGFFNAFIYGTFKENRMFIYEKYLAFKAERKSLLRHSIQ